MKLYIQVENGVTINHPALEDNLLGVYNGEIPTDWEPFERIEKPILGVYEILDSMTPTYQKIDGVWKDVWAVRSMTNEEKTAKQQSIKDLWVNNNNYTSWIFNEDLCIYEPPVPPPNDNKTYFWVETSGGWVEVADYPSDDKMYIMDINTLTWVETTPN